MERLVADAVAEHPRAVAAAPPLLRQAAADLVERRAAAQVDAAGRQRAPERVDVAVGQPGEDGRAAPVDPVASRAPLADLVVAPTAVRTPSCQAIAVAAGRSASSVGRGRRGSRRRRWACRDRIVVAHGLALVRRARRRAGRARGWRRRARPTSASSAPATPACGPPTSCGAPTPRSTSSCSSARSPASAPRVATAAGCPASSPARTSTGRRGAAARARSRCARAIARDRRRGRRACRARGDRLRLRQGRRRWRSRRPRCSPSGCGAPVARAQRGARTPRAARRRRGRRARSRRRRARRVASRRTARASSPPSSCAAWPRGRARRRARSTRARAVDEIAPRASRTPPPATCAPAGSCARPRATRAALPGLRRTLLPLNSSMIVTEPLDGATWARDRLGGRARRSRRRARVRVRSSGRPTAASRSAGAASRTASARAPTATARSPSARSTACAGACDALFPVLARRRIDARLARRARHRARLGAGGRRRPGDAASPGRAATSARASPPRNLAARTLRDLILGEHRPDRAAVGRPARARWEPEPLRFVAVHGVYGLMAAADGRRRGRAPGPSWAGWPRRSPAALAVVPRVLPNGDAADRWPVPERAVVVGGVVVLEPDREGLGAGVCLSGSAVRRPILGPGSAGSARLSRCASGCGSGSGGVGSRARRAAHATTRLWMWIQALSVCRRRAVMPCPAKNASARETKAGDGRGLLVWVQLAEHQAGVVIDDRVTELPAPGRARFSARGAVPVPTVTACPGRVNRARRLVSICSRSPGHGHSNRRT